VESSTGFFLNIPPKPCGILNRDIQSVFHRRAHMLLFSGIMVVALYVLYNYRLRIVDPLSTGAVITIGYFCLGLGIVVLACTNIVRSYAEKIKPPRAAKVEQVIQSKFEKRKCYYWFGVMVVTGALANFSGSWLIRRASEAESKPEREKRARKEREQDERLQQIAAALAVAKRGDSVRMTEEKINVVQPDLDAWAASLKLVKNDIDRSRQEFKQAQEQAKQQEERNQLQMSEQAVPAILYALRYVQESVRAYSKRLGKQIRVDEIELPKNFYTKTLNSEIRFSTNSVWKFQVLADPPAVNDGWHWPHLQINFSDFNGQGSGDLRLDIAPPTKELGVVYHSTVPMPDPKGISGTRSLEGYENQMRDIFQQVLRTQLYLTQE
jgi:hypothetical protein